MSFRDYAEHHLELPSLVGRPCFLSLATNSVKLHIDENKSDGTYLWIDPPWQFGRHGEVIESSDSCPFHEDDGYDRKFAEWCSRFAPAFDTRIESIEALPDGSLWISLVQGYAFFVPTEFFPDDPPLWYDHWYLRKEPQPNAGGSEPGSASGLTDAASRL